MPSDSRYIAERIARPADAVYAYAVDPEHLPRWAPGLCTAVENVDGAWFIETGDGRAAFSFAPRNPFGVLDHDVLLPAGQAIHVPMRVVADGDASEIVFTLRPTPDMSPADVDRDAALVAADLARLKAAVEGHA